MRKKIVPFQLSSLIPQLKEEPLFPEIPNLIRQLSFGGHYSYGDDTPSVHDRNRQYTILRHFLDIPLQSILLNIQIQTT